MAFRYAKSFDSWKDIAQYVVCMQKCLAFGSAGFHKMQLDYIGSYIVQKAFELKRHDPFELRKTFADFIKVFRGEEVTAARLDQSGTGAVH